MRVTNASASRKRRRRWIKSAKGFWLRRSKLYRYAKGALDHGDYKGPVVNHAVEIHQSSLLKDVLGVSHTTVNSTHHQGIRDLGKKLTPVAYAPDGLVEAVEPINGKTKFLAVQWHPEQMPQDKIQMKLFRWLVEEAAE